MNPFLLLLLFPLLGKKKRTVAKKAAPKTGKKRTGGGRKNVMRWADDVREEIARSHPEVPLPMALTIMHMESGGNPEATNCRAERNGKWVHYSCNNRECRDAKGNKIPGATPWAQGLYQFLKKYQKGQGITDPYDPKQSIGAGVRLIASNIKKAKEKWGGDLRYAVVAHNTGPASTGGGVAQYYPRFSAQGKAYLAAYDRLFPLYENER